MFKKTCDKCINWTIVPDCTTWGDCNRNKEYLMGYDDFCSRWEPKNKKVDPGFYENNWNELKVWLMGFVNPEGRFNDAHQDMRDVFRKMYDLETGKKNGNKNKS